MIWRAVKSNKRIKSKRVKKRRMRHLVVKIIHRLRRRKKKKILPLTQKTKTMMMRKKKKCRRRWKKCKPWWRKRSRKEPYKIFWPTIWRTSKITISKSLMPWVRLFGCRWRISANTSTSWQSVLPIKISSSPFAPIKYSVSNGEQCILICQRRRKIVLFPYFKKMIGSETWMH